MIKSHKGAEKLVNEFTGGDPSPTWEDRLKNQQGYGRTSSLAKSIHGFSHSDKKSAGDEQAQLLSNLGVKTFEENCGPEKAEDAFVAKGKKIV